MKKIIICLSALGLITLSSCKKEFTCSCVMETEQTFTDENGTPQGDPTTSETTSSHVLKDKEDDARVQCEGNNGTIEQNTQSGGMHIKQEITTNCTLK